MAVQRPWGPGLPNSHAVAAKHPLQRACTSHADTTSSQPPSWHLARPAVVPLLTLAGRFLSGRGACGAVAAAGMSAVGTDPRRALRLQLHGLAAAHPHWSPPPTIELLLPVPLRCPR